MNNEVYDPDIFARNLDAFKALLVESLRESLARNSKVLEQKSIAEILALLKFDELLAHGNGDLPALAKTILENSNHLHHPRYFGHQVAVPMLTSCLGDLLNGVTNNGMAVYEMGPAGTAIERGLIRWMLAKAGWPQGDGALVHGGSLANLSALLAARANVLPEAWQMGVPRDNVILVSEAAHYSISRTVAILGFGTSAIVKVPVDATLRVKSGAVQETFKRVTTSGKKVLAVVANAGATPTGAFDPIKEIGAFCRENNLWLHVDGAHGASALISEKHRALLDGIECADSLAWDTHKMLGTSVLCGAVLFRDAASLSGTYAQHAPYLFSDFEKPGEDISKNTFECTKAMLSLKLFFNLAAIGEKGMALHVEKLFALTYQFFEHIRARKGFECRCPPQCNILCFRYGADSEAQDRIRNDIVREGNFYITRTTIDNEAWLRLVIMNPFTKMADIEALCAEIERLMDK